MKSTALIGITLTAVVGTLPLAAQGRAEFNRLELRVAELEKQVAEISKLVGPMKEQQTADQRRKALRRNFEDKMARDAEKYSREQLREAESLYQVANRKWGTDEAAASLRKMIEKYPDINRTGCAVLYIAQKSKDGEREKHLRDCIEKYNGCFYGDGVQVGAYARYLLAGDYQRAGEAAKAAELFDELRSDFPDAVDHRGNLLVDRMPAK